MMTAQAIATREQNQPAIIQDLLASASELASQSRTDSTKNAYASDWSDFVDFADSVGADTLPAQPETVVLYVTHLSKSRGYKVSTIRRRLVAISQFHKLQGYRPPTSDAKVTSVVKGIARQCANDKERSKDEKRPITEKMIKQWVAMLEDTPRDIRDKAVILIGFAGAFRRSEIAGIDAEDIERQPDGLIISLRQSKTNQEGKGELVGIPYGKHKVTCPVIALESWLKVAGIESGPIFRTVTRWGKIKDSRIAGRTVARVVKRMIDDLGLDPDEYGGHSLRSGHATQATNNGAPQAVTMSQTRHKSEHVFRGYYRRGNVLKQNSAKYLDL
jgi:site-specific recombinase XerD